MCQYFFLPVIKKAPICFTKYEDKLHSCLTFASLISCSGVTSACISVQTLLETVISQSRGVAVCTLLPQGEEELTDEQRRTCLPLLLLALASSCTANAHKHLIQEVWITTNLKFLLSSSKLPAQKRVAGGGMVVVRWFPSRSTSLYLPRWFTGEQDSPRSLPEPWATSGWAQPVEVRLAEHIRHPRSSRERRRSWQTRSGILVQ